MNILNDESTINQYKKQIKEKYPIDTENLGWRTYSPGEFIYEQEFPIPFLSLLVKGKVKIFSTSEDGRRLIVTFNKPLEIFGELELVQQVNTIHSIEAVTLVHIATLSSETAKKLLEDSVLQKNVSTEINKTYFSY